MQVDKRICPENIDIGPLKKQKTLSAEMRIDELRPKIGNLALESEEFGRHLFQYMKDNPADQKIWNAVFEQLNIPTFKITFNSGYTCTLPLHIWKLHSEYFWNLATWIKNNQEFVEELEVSDENIEMFMQCLVHCNQCITLENYPDILKLADKYQVNWLREDCKQFYKVFALDVAVQYMFTEDVGRQIRGLIQEKTTFSPLVKAALNKLCDDYQLVDLKLYLLDVPLDILSDGTLHLQIKKDTDVAAIKKCLAFRNGWYAPRIELSCREPSEADYQTLNEVVEMCQFPITVRIDYERFAVKATSGNLNEMLHKYPSLKSVKVLIPGINAEHFVIHKDNIKKMIKENKSLESLYIIFYTMNKRIKEEYYDDTAIKELKECLETNTTLKNLFFTFTKELDPITKAKPPNAYYRLYPLRGDVGKKTLTAWDLKTLEKQALDYETLKK